MELNDYKIEIFEQKPMPEGLFKIVISGKTETEHFVDLMEDYHLILTEGRVKPKELIKKSFEFLLEREPNTAILKKFILNEIGNYFPEYESEIKKHFYGTAGL